jgi:phage shock protein PspC (stress-responsive transcriptional regulator)
MQKTISISLGRMHFYVEEDAYARLSAYLESVKVKFAGYPDGEEIVSDIENRIAEHFLASRGEDRERVIRLSEVQSLITSMGEPEEMEGGPKPAAASATETPSKRLYRNTDDAIIAGVASGIAGYLGLEPVVIRLLFIAFTVMNGFGILLYLILWVVLPEAKTATEKLEMKGKAVTLESVDRLMKQAAGKVKGPNGFSKVVRGVARFLETFFRKLFPVLGKIFGVILGLVAAVALFALTMSFALALTNIRSPYVDFPLAESLHGPLLYALLTSGFFTIVVPLLFLGSLAAFLVRGRTGRKNKWALGLLGLWFVSAITLGVSVTKAMPLYSEYIRTNPAYRTEVRSYDLKDFTAVQAHNGLSLEVRQGSEFRVEAEARVRDLDSLALQSVSGTLSAARGRNHEGSRICIFCDSRGRVALRITAPRIERIEGQNAVYVHAEGIGGESFRLVLRNGSNADITLGTTTQAIEVTLENAAGAELAGRAVMATYVLRNGVHLEAEGLEVDRIEIDASNATHARVNAGEEIKGSIANGSSLFYIGSPRVTVSTRNASQVEPQFGEEINVR